MTTREPVVRIGDVVEGRYRIIKVLGEGGMGTVFLAEHALIKRRVALKVLHPELAADADVIERFMNEARAAGTLGHPNIVESTDMGFTQERVPYIVFEFLEGALLTDEIYRVAGFTIRRAVRIAQQIASALHAAHVAGIVHRDLKSDNVFLTDKDEALDHVKVLDFGISRFLALEDEKTRRGMVMGTPEFMAPEQITAPDTVDRRADIYALGVILYEMLTARRPFSNEDDPRALLGHIVHTAPPPLGRDDVPHALAELILHKMLAKNPDERFPTMIDAEAALAAFGTQSELGGLRRARATITRPVIANAVIDKPGAAASTIATASTMPATAPASAAPGKSGPTVKSAEQADLARRQARLDTDDQMAAVALPNAPIHKKPWLLYSIAGIGVAVGVAGFLLGTRGGDDARPAAPIAVAPVPTPAPAAVPPAQPTAMVAIPTPPVVSKVEIRVDASVPGAHVTFRRRVLDLPAQLEINESDIVEVVEVFATGYKTERYWLTFDRPTHLAAKLTRGDGLAEATEVETLVALGEMAEPAPEAAPPDAGTAHRVAAKQAPHRKIGRSAAPPAAVAAALHVATPAGGSADPAHPDPAAIDAVTSGFADGAAAAAGAAPAATPAATPPAGAPPPAGHATAAKPVEAIDAVSTGVADGPHTGSAARPVAAPPPPGDPGAIDAISSAPTAN